ncbi:MAG: molecular chaperone HtpG [Victivallales bacterium]|nr:molecular chaperone HtpG [Victivallales bacterium]
MSAQTKKFKTEVQHLLDLMIHSLYSNKDIFLRELIANAADAIDKARFESLRNDAVSRDWTIRLETVPAKNAIRISDNGIGMTMDEVIANIGTIAKSGTKAFLEELAKNKDAVAPEMIGQFGVGFYSAFMVADKVELLTRRAGSDTQAVVWTSQGHESYTIDATAKEDQGTEVTVYLKDDMKEYLEEWKIRQIVKKYSDFIEYPIKMQVTRKDKDDKEEVVDEELNSRKAIWLRSPSEVKPEEYDNFFEHLAHFGKPLKTIHYAAEGKSEFKALLFLPEKAPFDLFMPSEQRRGLHLYVRRVFITDECKKLLPDYFRFVKGVVDSSDLPLNVSREILQENVKIDQIRNNLVKKLLGELKKMQENEPETYLKFYREFGKVLKEGIHSDYANKDKLQDLALFETMKNEPGKLITLKEYVANMPSEQKDIYFLTGESRSVLENSPHLEILRSKGYDVLFLSDPIDEWVMQSLTEYDGKKFAAAGKGDIELDDATKKQVEQKNEQAAKEHKSLLEFLAKHLEANVKEVRFSKRLTESACCLVGDTYDPGAHMERIFKAMNQDMPKSKRILELNAAHPLIAAMQTMYDRDAGSPQLGEYAEMIYDQAVMTEGGIVADPLQFARRVADLMVKATQ